MTQSAATATWPQRSAFLLLTLALSLAASCKSTSADSSSANSPPSSSSSSKKGKKSEFGPTLGERIDSVRQIAQKQDFSKRSQYEKKLAEAKTGKEFKASKYATKEAAGFTKTAHTKDSYKTKSFAQSDKSDKTDEKKFRGSTEQDKLASKLFHVPENKFGSESSSFAGKKFSSSSEAFTTREDPVAGKEMAKNKRPLILKPEKPTYSEDEVKRMLNKN